MSSSKRTTLMLTKLMQEFLRVLLEGHYYFQFTWVIDQMICLLTVSFLQTKLHFLKLSMATILHFLQLAMAAIKNCENLRTSFLTEHFLWLLLTEHFLWLLLTTLSLAASHKTLSLAASHNTFSGSFSQNTSSGCFSQNTFSGCFWISLHGFSERCCERFLVKSFKVFC